MAQITEQAMFNLIAENFDLMTAKIKKILLDNETFKTNIKSDIINDDVWFNHLVQTIINDKDFIAKLPNEDTVAGKLSGDQAFINKIASQISVIIGGGTQYFSGTFSTTWQVAIDSAVGSGSARTGDQIKISKGALDYFGVFIDGTKNIDGVIYYGSIPVGLMSINYAGDASTDTFFSNIRTYTQKEWTDLPAELKGVGTMAYIQGATTATDKVIMIKTNGTDFQFANQIDIELIKTRLSKLESEIDPYLHIRQLFVQANIPFAFADLESHVQNMRSGQLAVFNDKTNVGADGSIGQYYFIGQAYKDVYGKDRAKFIPNIPFGLVEQAQSSDGSPARIVGIFSYAQEQFGVATFNNTAVPYDVMKSFTKDQYFTELGKTDAELEKWLKTAAFDQFFVDYGVIGTPQEIDETFDSLLPLGKYGYTAYVVHVIGQGTTKALYPLTKDLIEAGKQCKILFQRQWGGGDL